MKKAFFAFVISVIFLHAFVDHVSAEKIVDWSSSTVENVSNAFDGNLDTKTNIIRASTSKTITMFFPDEAPSKVKVYTSHQGGTSNSKSYIQIIFYNKNNVTLSNKRYDAPNGGWVEVDAPANTYKVFIQEQLSYSTDKYFYVHEIQFDWPNVPEEPTPTPTPTPTPSPPDEEPPQVPQGVTVEPGDKKALVNWTKNSDDTTGYYIYVDGQRWNAIPITGPPVTVINLQNGRTYTIQVTAIDAAGNESEKSDAVQVTPQKVPEQLLVTFTPNVDSIVIRIKSGNPPYTVEWDGGSDEFDGQQYVIKGLESETDYTVKVSDSEGQEVTQVVNTGKVRNFIPPNLPTPTHIFQMILDRFGDAGLIGLAIILAAVALGVIVVMALWAWRMTKRWFATTK